MDKIEEIDSLITHNINLVERKNILISGVKKIESFDNEEFLIETLSGFVLVRGENLEIIKLDTIKGTINIKGRIDSLTYIDENRKQKDKDNNGVISRLFK